MLGRRVQRNPEAKLEGIYSLSLLTSTNQLPGLVNRWNLSSWAVQLRVQPGHAISLSPPTLNLSYF